MEFANLDYAVVDRVAEITMRRAPVNAINHALIEDINNAYRKAKADPGVRAIILTSTTPFLQAFHPAPAADRALRDLLATCRRERIGVVLVSMPESSAFRDAYPPAVRAGGPSEGAHLHADVHHAVQGAAAAGRLAVEGLALAGVVQEQHRHSPLGQALQR